MVSPCDCWVLDEQSVLFVLAALNVSVCGGVILRGVSHVWQKLLCVQLAATSSTLDSSGCTHLFVGGGLSSLGTVKSKTVFHKPHV